MLEEIATTNDARDLLRIEKIVKASLGIDRARLLKNSHMMARRLDELLLTLMQSRRVIAKKVDTETKPKNLYYVPDKRAKKQGGESSQESSQN